MSTLDTALNSGAMVLSDLLGRKGSNPAMLRWQTAGLTFALALFAGGVATWVPDILSVLGLSSEIIAVGLVIPILATGRYQRCPPVAAWASTLCGLGITAASFIAAGAAPSWPAWLRWPEILPPGLILSGLVFFAFAEFGPGTAPRDSRGSYPG